MVVKPSGSETEVSPLQSENDFAPMPVTDPGSVSEVIPLHLYKARLAILVNVSGKARRVSPVQLLNDSEPMLVSETGSVTEVSPLHL